MKPNELRIGNWVYVTTNCKNEKVKNIHENFGTFVEGIPLTEEWLVNLGFIKRKGRHGIYFKHETQDLVRVWSVSENKTQWGIGRKDLDSQDRFYNTHWIVLNLKHVHQLQNLFFALTSEELKALEEKKEQTESSIE